MSRDEIINLSETALRELFTLGGINLPEKKDMGAFRDSPHYRIEEGEMTVVAAFAATQERAEKWPHGPVYSEIGRLNLPKDWHLAWIGGGEFAPCPNYSGWEKNQRAMRATFE